VAVVDLQVKDLQAVAAELEDIENLQELLQDVIRFPQEVLLRQQL
tara:strand:+ start:53 stop:187 length:135 start_codon:yes stop_codon:yes gene_type:complete